MLIRRRLFIIVVNIIIIINVEKMATAPFFSHWCSICAPVPCSRPGLSPIGFVVSHEV